MELKIRIWYSRKGIGCYLSHLDSMNILVRAVRRAGIPYKTTEGCHIRPKMSFGPPLPLGHASSCEFFDVHLTEKIDLRETSAMLGCQMPKGFELTKIESIEAKEAFVQECTVRYEISVKPDSSEIIEKIISFLTDSERIIPDPNPKANRNLEFSKARIKAWKSSEKHAIIMESRQGQKNSPSSSKILGALLIYLGPEKEEILEMERVSLKPILSSESEKN